MIPGYTEETQFPMPDIMAAHLVVMKSYHLIKLPILRPTLNPVNLSFS